MVQIPPCKTHNSLNINYLLKHVQDVSQNSWLLALLIIIDEKTVGFRGNHKEKIWITYKTEGDGFQMDEICDCGFRYSFYLHNQPPPPPHQPWTLTVA